jgi:hypothetical protein
MLVLQDASTSNGEIAHITGGTTNAPTASTLAHLDGTNNCTFITQSPIDSNHTLCAYNNATTGQGSLAVIQANGTNAPTVISRMIFHPMLAWYNSLSAHSSNDHSLVFMDNENDANHIVVHVDSSYNITTSASSKFYGTNATEHHAVAALTPTTAIAAFQGTGSDGFAGTLTLTPTPVISGQLLGIAETSATNGATASVAIGPIVEGTYTSGADYYASGAGGLTVTPTPVHVLKAKSTTEGVLDLRGAPEAGKQQVWEITVPGAFTWTAPEDGEYEFLFCAGGGGGSRSTGRALSGNGGNTVLLSSVSVKSGASITGSIGTGGVGRSSTAAGGDGGDTFITINGNLYAAKGGKGGTSADASATAYAAFNAHNLTDKYNILGENANSQVFTSGSVGCRNGVAQMIPGSRSIINDNGGGNGYRGSGGGTTTSGTSGYGGDGYLSITLVYGS